jgi:hypothetical protein
LVFKPEISQQDKEANLLNFCLPGAPKMELN